MVATRLWEVTSKGQEWLNQGNDNDSVPATPRQSNLTSSSHEGKNLPSRMWLPQEAWQRATSSVQNMARTSYHSLTNLVTSKYDNGDIYEPGSPYEHTSSNTRRQDYHRHRKQYHRRWSMQQLGDTMALQNPYHTVRGRRFQEPSSIAAVRHLLALVPPTATRMTRRASSSSSSSSADHIVMGDLPSMPSHHGQDKADALERSWSDGTTGTHEEYHMPTLTLPFRAKSRRHYQRPFSDAETASQIAEGTLRAWRDLALDEAVELHEALRYWSHRWQRPLLSWLEAGPWVWFGIDHGYQHAAIGHKVSQIQAVLARRCAAIGELQQHLLRAGWQRGVAQWGVLGQGGQWAAVAGFDGSVHDVPSATSGLVGDGALDHGAVRRSAEDLRQADPVVGMPIQDATNLPPASFLPDLHAVVPPPAPPHAEPVQQRAESSSRAHVCVRKRDGGGIFVDDPHFLTEWSVEAILLVRRQMSRSCNGMIILPYEPNWRKEERQDEEAGTTILDAADLGPDWNHSKRFTPLWASTNDAVHHATRPAQMGISDLSLMAEEVSELLDVMENVMIIQRQRRLMKLRAPRWWRRNWFILATAVPTLGLFSYRFAMAGTTKESIRHLFSRIYSLFNERVREPVAAIFNEIWQGRESFSDLKARMEAMEALKKMIRSWLDDNFHDMPEEQRIAMAEAMDLSLIERKKEESMKTFYEINNVIRMSFIEMQYMKKEMMAALHAMDAMMSANDINMNIAAITPVLLAFYGCSRLFRFFYYALLKIGKSREETYATFRYILTDIERLLVMRDDPPASWPMRGDATTVETAGARPDCRVLGRDDVGMLMLLVHELRTIMWNESRRFHTTVAKSVSEDLAELVGERGVVSIPQQILILMRMSRTYPFLKVISTGHMFQYID